MTRSEQSPSSSACVCHRWWRKRPWFWTNMPSRKEGWMERGKKKENERLIIEGGAQITHKWQSYGYGTLDNESEWCVLTHRNPSSLGCNHTLGKALRDECVCVYVKETFEGVEVRSVSHSVCILQMRSVLISDPCRASMTTLRNIHFCHHSASCQTKHISPSACA